MPVSVEVASTATTIAGPFDVVGGTYAEVALTNTDGSQTLNAWVESSPDGTTWNAKLNWQGLDAIAAGELRYEGFVSFLGGPLVVESGRFFHVILQVPVGTATASQIIRGVVQVTGRYEQ